MRGRWCEFEIVKRVEAYQLNCTANDTPRWRHFMHSMHNPIVLHSRVSILAHTYTHTHTQRSELDCSNTKRNESGEQTIRIWDDNDDPITLKYAISNLQFCTYMNMSSVESFKVQREQGCVFVSARACNEIAFCIKIMTTGCKCNLFSLSQCGRLCLWYLFWPRPPNTVQRDLMRTYECGLMCVHDIKWLLWCKHDKELLKSWCLSTVCFCFLI